jgi:hypothetical protein
LRHENTHLRGINWPERIVHGLAAKPVWLESEHADYDANFNVPLDVLTEDSQCIVLVGCGALNRKVARLSQTRTAIGQQNT